MPEYLNNVDIVWVLVCAMFVMAMQGGFCFLESGLVRAKNSINVAIKNLVDFSIAALLFWLVGFGLMFGASHAGLFGTSNFAFDEIDNAKLSVFFLFQLVFSGTATTIISGAVAERTRFAAYVMVAALVSALIYPVFGHWVWGGQLGGQPGWLAQQGFMDFAGASVVHSVGGWSALAMVLIVGPRIGFAGSRRIEGHDLPKATLGVLLLWVGWWGFNGGSQLQFDSHVPGIIVTTNLAAAAGGLTALILSCAIEKRPIVNHLFNGILAGLVSVTGCCNHVSPIQAVIIGSIGGVVAELGSYGLKRLNVDDVIDAVPVHAFAGTWGVIAVALFAAEDALLAGSRQAQLFVQLKGTLICFCWAFGVSYSLMRIVNCFVPLRVCREHEIQGLNISEHGATTELIDLLSEMQIQAVAGDFSKPVSVEPHTEVGQIATQYNRVIRRANVELDQRERAVAAVQLAEEQYQLIFENSTDGIYQKDALGRITRTNPALLGILGIESAEQLHSPDLVPSWLKDEDRRNSYRATLQADGKIENFESSFERANGETVWIAESMQGIRNQAGDLLFYQGTMTDITAIKRRSELQIEAAQDASRAKSQFLANMSHEIRTPLNGVVGMLDLLANEQLNDRQAHFVDVASSSSQTLLALINDILDFSKIEAGKLEIAPTEFSIHELVEDASDVVAHMATQKGLEVTCRIDAEVPDLVFGDAERIRQILVNFANNAVKFTNQGDVHIEVGVTNTVADMALVRFEIVDTGIGIPESKLANLFTLFTQVDASTTRRYGGTGLGLAISRQLAEIMSGQVGAESEEGKGSKFWFEVPLPVREASQRPWRRGLAFDDQKVRILAVDDNLVNLDILREQIGSWGVEVATCSDPNDVSRTLRQAHQRREPFDLLISDFQMPEMDGLSLSELVRGLPDVGQIPIVMLSSSCNMISEEDVYRLSLAGTLTKPVRQSRLYDSIMGILGVGLSEPRSAESTPNEPAARQPVGADAGVDIDRADFRLLVVDDNRINRIVAQEILRVGGYDCEFACDGLEAVNKIKAETFDLVLMDCHMPIMDGFEAVREVRKLESAGKLPHSPRSLPIIAVTANAVKGQRETCIEAGMNEHVTKPIDGDLLLKTVAHYLPTETSGNAATQDTKTGNSKLDQNRSGESVVSELLNEQLLLDRCMGNRECAIEILQDFCEQGPRVIREIYDALEQDDAEDVYQKAHLLKGSSSSIAATAVAEIVTSMEINAKGNDLEKVGRELTDLERVMKLTLDFVDRLLIKEATS